jgi:hypothetical protein
MDLTESIAPRSDQVNADDLIGGPITYTIREVRQGAAEQPFDFMLVETDRAYRPSKTMRRLIVAAWGPDTKAYTGRRLTLYREPSIMFGGQRVGGIRISHMSGIDKRIEEKFQTTRGKREAFRVDPLPDLSPVDQLRAEWKHADPERRKAIEAEVDALTKPQTELAEPVRHADEVPVADGGETPRLADEDPTLDPEWAADHA